VFAHFIFEGLKELALQCVFCSLLEAVWRPLFILTSILQFSCSVVSLPFAPHLVLFLFNNEHTTR